MEGIDEKELMSKEEEEISYNILHHAIKEWIFIEDKKIPVVDAKLKHQDILGAVLVRLGIKRYSYKIPTGLYAVGRADEKSPVLVTGNYKLSFDALRKELDDSGYWILVLDTKGINVWCAAGKGTFSTRELIFQIKKWELHKIVKTNKIILPQLGASSMEAYLLRKFTKFNIVYGPVRSSDLKSFLQNGNTADEAMRTVTFNTLERMVLTPIELIMNFKYVLMLLPFFLLINIFMGTYNVLIHTILNIIPFVLANVLGSMIFPLLLPLLPFRSFSIKGAVLGAAFGLWVSFNSKLFMFSHSPLSICGIFILVTCLTSYTSFNFTGSTTFTSFSGVKKESRIFIPAALAAASLGVLLYIIGVFI